MAIRLKYLSLIDGEVFVAEGSNTLFLRTMTDKGIRWDELREYPAAPLQSAELEFAFRGYRHGLKDPLPTLPHFTVWRYHGEWFFKESDMEDAVRLLAPPEEISNEVQWAQYMNRYTYEAPATILSFYSAFGEMPYGVWSEGEYLSAGDMTPEAYRSLVDVLNGD